MQCAQLAMASLLNSNAPRIALAAFPMVLSAYGQASCAGLWGGRRLFPPRYRSAGQTSLVLVIASKLISAISGPTAEIGRIVAFENVYVHEDYQGINCQLFELLRYSFGPLTFAANS